MVEIRSDHRTGLHSGHNSGPRSGFTLIELLVAIGIIVVMMGLAVPMVASALDRRRMTSVAEEVVGALLMARAHAQAEGVTVEIILVEASSERGPRRMQAREIDLHAPPFEDEEGPPPLMRAWADVAVQWPLRLTLVGDDDDDLDAEPSARPEFSTDHEIQLEQRRGDGAWSTNVALSAAKRVAVFAANGSAIVAPRLRIVNADGDGNGRFIEIVVNPFTGLPRIATDPRASVESFVDPDPDADPDAQIGSDSPLDAAGDDSTEPRR